jgi:Mg/Co/Ni transporter MgtE
VAAETLEELDRKVQVSVVESLDSDRAADIVEYMDPDAAADLLGDLTEAASGMILGQMEPEDRHGVRHLLEFDGHTAAGRMTTEFLSVAADASVHDAIEALRGFEGGVESVATIYLAEAGGELVGAVPLVKAILVGRETLLRDLSAEPLVSCLGDTPDDQVAELFDKYNLFTLPVVDDHRRLTGIITADDVISFLRNK